MPLPCPNTHDPTLSPSWRRTALLYPAPGLMWSSSTTQIRAGKSLIHILNVPPHPPPAHYCSIHMSRYLTVEKEVKPGEVLLIEKPYSSILLPEYYTTHCQVFQLTLHPAHLSSNYPVPPSCSSTLVPNVGYTAHVQTCYQRVAAPMPCWSCSKVKH